MDPAGLDSSAGARNIFLNLIIGCRRWGGGQWSEINLSESTDATIDMKVGSILVIVLFLFHRSEDLTVPYHSDFLLYSLSLQSILTSVHK